LLDTTSGGSFLHVSSENARLTLDKILSSELDNILEVELEPQVANASALPDTPSTSAIPCSEPQEEEETSFPNFILDIEHNCNTLKFALFQNSGN
jgi:hypothetical protein